MADEKFNAAVGMVDTESETACCSGNVVPAPGRADVLLSRLPGSSFAGILQAEVNF